MFEAIIPFKFQSDSINTDVSPSSNRALHHFKFQSDSINTCHHFQSRDIFSVAKTVSFKFQSDSINTVSAALICSTTLSLNSNLILLIPAGIKRITISQSTLNSNLILLILIPFTQHITQMLNFKFQSDSINTILQLITGLTCLLTLNSNLILLILFTSKIFILRIFTLNSNLILLIHSPDSIW